MVKSVWPAAAARARSWIAPAALGLALAAAPALGMEKDNALAQLKANGIAVTPASLVQYAALGDAAIVALLVDAGVAVNEREPARRVSALHNAAAQGHLRLAARLIEQGAQVDAEDWYGVTPLVAASAAGHLQVVELLVAKGSNVNVVPQHAPTALIIAIGRGDLALVEALLKAGARPALPDAFGRSPLEAANLAGSPQVVKRVEAAVAQGGA